MGFLIVRSSVLFLVPGGDGSAIAAPLPASAGRTSIDATTTGGLAEQLPPGSGAAVAVPQVGLRADVVPIDFSGVELDPPEDVRLGGIWAGGEPLAGARPKPTVVVGHVSDGRDRPGSFRALWEARRGMLAVTRDDAGALRTWRVVRVRTFAKERLPRALFLPEGERVLRLITCAERVGGSDGSFHYRANLVVDLVPVVREPAGGQT